MNIDKPRNLPHAFQLYAALRSWTSSHGYSGDILGTYTENLVSRALCLTLEPAANPGYDAVDNNSQKYQIKGQFESVNQWSGFTDKQLAAFHFLVCVIYTSSGDIKSAYLIPAGVARQKARGSAQGKRWIYYKNDLWNCKGVIDIKETLTRTSLNWAGE